jgi:branched-chain amino acid transport system permease protein
MGLAPQVLQYLLSGVVVGGIYALVGLGFVIIYSVTRVINFAQGEFAMLGALFMVTLLGWGLPLPLACVLAAVGGCVVGALLERAAIHPVRGGSPLTLIIITIGASTAVRGGALLAWGTDPFPLPAFTPGPPLQLGGAIIVRQGLWVLAVALAIFAGLWAFFTKSYLGKAVQACAINPRASRLMGIRVDRMFLLAFALAGGLGAVAGIVIAPITYATYDMGLMLGLKGFVAAVVGGLVSPPGAIVGGFLLGILESLAAGLVSSGYKDAFAFLILILICLAQVARLLPWRVVEET